MSMKLSYRDKVIFIVVIVLIVLAVGFFVFIKAKMQESEEIQANLESKQMELDEVHAKIDTLPDLQNQLDDIIKEVDDMQAPFLDEQETFEADRFIYDLASQVPGILYFQSMEMTGEEAKDISPYWYARKTVAYDVKMNSDLSGDSLKQEEYDQYYNTLPQPPANAMIAVETMKLTVVVNKDSDGTADWDTIFEIIDTISHHENTLYLKSLEVSIDQDVSTGWGSAEQKDTCTAEFNIDIYSVHKMDTSQAK